MNLSYFIYFGCELWPKAPGKFQKIGLGNSWIFLFQKSENPEKEWGQWLAGVDVLCSYDDLTPSLGAGPGGQEERGVHTATTHATHFISFFLFRTHGRGKQEWTSWVTGKWGNNHSMDGGGGADT